MGPCVPGHASGHLHAVPAPVGGRGDKVLEDKVWGDKGDKVWGDKVWGDKVG